MPSNSGLYEDSDTDSLANELSPTDGYFNRRPTHPQDVLVPDPSQDNTGNSDKAREARQESENSAASRRQSHLTTPSTSSGRRIDPAFEEETYTESSPLIPSAPPTYSAATAGRQFAPTVSHNPPGGNITDNGHNTMGRQEIFLPTGDPEDLGGRSDGYSDGFGKRDWRKQVRSLFKIEYLFICVVLAIGVGFITSAILGVVNHHKASKTPLSGPISGSPGERLPNDVFRSCPSGVYHASASFTFERPLSFAFVQTTNDEQYVDGAAYRRIHTVGEIHVKPLLDHMEDSIRVSLDVHLSDSTIMQEIYWTPQDDSLVIRLPNQFYSESGSSNPCMYIAATIWVAPYETPKELIINTRSFSVIVDEDLSTNLKTLSIDAIAGSVTFPSRNSTLSNFNYREVVVKTVSGSIHGSFALYDLLQITSNSGSITIDVDPKDATEKDPLPAKLILETTSGTIRVDTPSIAGTNKAFSSSVIPARDYRTRITSVSGSVTVTLLHGSDTQLHTSSGSVHATLAPYGFIDSQSGIDVKTNSGTTGVTVLSSLSHPGHPMRHLCASYRQMSGSLSLTYPGEWEGGIEGTVLSGSVSYVWPGLQVLEDGTKGYGFKRFKAYKHFKDTRLTFESISGSVTLKGGSTAALSGGGANGGKGHDLSERPGRGGPGKEKEEPDMGGAPPSRWPGYSDEWGFAEGGQE